MTVDSDAGLRALATAILAGDSERTSNLLADSPGLATACFRAGATRNAEQPYFLAEISRYIFAGDTALHIAAAGYQTKLALRLLEAGANVSARNRLGNQSIHAAAQGNPRSPLWNPEAQTAAILALIEAGADPNAVNRRGVSPLHIAVRTRCAAAAGALLNSGADPRLRNKNGSDAMLLATMNTGRGGTGSAEAKAEQKQILRMLQQSLDA